MDQELAELEAVYVRFNVSHPEGFRGRSMTMSDVVEVIRSERKAGFTSATGSGLRRLRLKGKADLGRL